MLLYSYDLRAGHPCTHLDVQGPRCGGPYVNVVINLHCSRARVL
jgi:hypothetical protein